MTAFKILIGFIVCIIPFLDIPLVYAHIHHSAGETFISQRDTKDNENITLPLIPSRQGRGNYNKPSPLTGEGEGGGEKVLSGEKVECEINKGACIKKINSVEIIFDISPKPVKAMEELRFSVRIKGLETSKLTQHIKIDLNMPGMHMGKNQVILKKISDNDYSGKGIIPT